MMDEQASDGLSKEQVATIKETWAVIYSNKVQSGVDFFLAFFKTYPHFKNHFKQLRDLDMEELKTSPKMKAHGLTVMHAIQSWIENLDETDVLVELVKKNAYRHHGRGLSKHEFDNLWQLFPTFLQMKLGDLYTESAQTAWGLALATLSAVTDAGIEEAAAAAEVTSQ